MTDADKHRQDMEEAHRAHDDLKAGPMIRIAITAEAFDAIAQTLPGNVGFLSLRPRTGPRRLERLFDAVLARRSRRVISPLPMVVDRLHLRDAGIAQRADDFAVRHVTAVLDEHPRLATIAREHYVNVVAVAAMRSADVVKLKRLPVGLHQIAACLGAAVTQYVGNPGRHMAIVVAQQGFEGLGLGNCSDRYGPLSCK